MTPNSFARALLGSLNLPVTDNNVAALVAIQRQEGGHQHNRAWFNPLNTMRRMPGAREAHLKVKGIKAYSSWEEGVAATAATLRQSNMATIVEALRRSAPPEETLAVFAASPWGWYEYQGGVRRPAPYAAASALVRSKTALSRYGETPYREAPVQGEISQDKPEIRRLNTEVPVNGPPAKADARKTLLLVGAGSLLFVGALVAYSMTAKRRVH